VLSPMLNNTVELIRRIEFALELQGKEVSRQGILRILNVEQRKLINELHIPIRYAKNLRTDRPISVPIDANPGGIRYAEGTIYNKQVELLTVSDANLLYPGWEDNANEGIDPYIGRGAPFVIYDPANISAPIYPVGFEDGDKLRIMYVLKPEELTFEDDSFPFMGEVPEYSEDLLYNAVMTDLCYNLGDARYKGFDAQLQEIKERAFNYSRPELHLAKLRGDSDED